MPTAYYFTEDVRSVLEEARQLAHRLGQNHIGAEHLAVALIGTPRGLLTKLLTAVDTSAVAAELDRRTRSARQAPSSDASALPYSGRATRILELAMRESYETRVPAVGVEHLLLALLHDQAGLVGHVLRDAGLDLDATRALIVRGGDTA